MKLIISNVSGVPIYEQIKRQVKAAILSGELKEEEALPSLRTLAKELQGPIRNWNRKGLSRMFRAAVVLYLVAVPNL